MSLATRCPACHTTFRVVQDQLKVSEGWVRCGRCNEVFNAIEGLFDLERDMPPESPVVAPPAASTFLAQASVAEPQAMQDTVAQPHVIQPATAPDRASPSPPDHASPSPPDRSSPSAPVRESLARTLAHARLEAEEHADEAPDAPTAYEVLDSRFLDRSTYGPTQRPEFDDGLADARVNAGAVQDIAVDANAWAPTTPTSSIEKPRSARARMLGDDESIPPAFLRDAARDADRQHPAARAMLVLAVIFLCLALAGQAALHWRDWLAAHYPASLPLIGQMCRMAQCRIGPLKSIEDVVVDSSSLARGSTDTDGYKLTVLLRNRSSVLLELPSIDLSLTDVDGSVIARRTLSPVDFRVGSTIAPRSEVPLSVNISTAGRRVTGYTVEAFYP